MGTMLKFRFLYWFIFCTISLFEAVYADDVIFKIEKNTQAFAIFNSSEFFEDTSGELSFEQVLNGNHTFLSVTEGSLEPSDFRRGLTRSAFWLKINLADYTGETQWFIQSWGSLNKKINAYIRSGSEQKYSELMALDGYLNSVFKFPSEPEMQHSLYLRTQDLQTPVDLAFHIGTTQVMLNQATQRYPVYAVLFGGLLILAMYNLFYFLYLRDVGFLALAVFIAAFALEFGNHLGVWNYFSITRHYLHYAGVGFGFIALAGVISVFCHLLELKQNTPRAYRFFQVAFWGCLGFALLAPFVYFGSAIMGIVGLILICAALLIVVVLYKKRYRFLKSMLLAGAIFMVSIVPPLLMGAGVIDIYGPLVDLPVLGLLIALILMSLTQAEQVRNKSEQAERTLAANHAKDEFLTTMSHELRTPMHAVVGAGRLLGMTKLQSEQRELVSRLDQSSNHMLSLINGILDLARTNTHLVSLESQPFKLNEVLESLEKLLRGSVDSKGLSLTLNNNFVPFRQELMGDATRLKQVLLNLLNNAIKFTEQGYVRLAITPQKVDDVSVRLLFAVSDTGIGIPKDKQLDLFQPFSQVDSGTSRRYGGTGLGLAISHKLVGLMGGELTVDSELGNGSCFSFTVDIPLRATISDADEAKDNATLAEPDQMNDFRVMLVDDDEMNRFFGAKLLEACGVTAVLAESGEQALDYLQRQAFDLILLDVSMPRMNGYQTVEAIRRQNRLSNVTVVALTAHGIEGVRERCLEAGMDDFMAKPYELSELQAMLSKYAEKQLPISQASSS